MTAGELCHLLPWDTEFFGVRVARVVGDALDADRAAAIDRWCAANAVALLYFLARSDAPATTVAAEDARYRLVDIRVTLERPPGIAPSPGASGEGGGEGTVSSTKVRRFNESDLAALRAIARTAYTDSRFYADPRIPRDKAAELFDRWTAQSAASPTTTTTLVAVDGDDAPLGYVTLDHGANAITLIGVAESARGRGVGLALVEAAIRENRGLVPEPRGSGGNPGSGLLKQPSRNAPSLTVVTQARNVPAQRLYQRCGFLTRSVQLYYHKWYV